MSCRRRQRHPGVLTELTAQHEVRLIRRRDEDIHAKGHGIAFPADSIIIGKHADPLLSRREPSGFIKLGIVRKVLFWNEGQNTAPLQNGCRVVELAAIFQREAQNDQHAALSGPHQQRIQGSLGRCHQGALMEQLTAGIRRHSKLREYQKRRAGLFCLLLLCIDRFYIKGRVRHTDFRCCRCCPQKAIFSYHTYLRKRAGNRRL